MSTKAEQRTMGVLMRLCIVVGFVLGTVAGVLGLWQLALLMILYGLATMALFAWDRP